MNLYKLALAVLISISITACLPDDEEDDRAAELSDLVGNWDFTEDRDDGTIDESYVVINSDGTFTNYDYYGDSYDDIANCYSVQEGTITDEGDGVFTISFGGDGFTFEFTIQMEFVDGELTETNTEDGEDFVWRESNIQESSYTPECTDADLSGS